MDLLKSLLLFAVFCAVESYNVYLQNGATEALTCILPAAKHADKVVLIKGSKKNNTLKVESSISNAGLDTVCYCGDPDKNYTFILENVDEHHDGRFKCIFYLGKNETHRHTINAIVLPKVDTYWYLNDQHVCYVCNITKPRNIDELKVYMVSGGVNITNRFLRDFKSTQTNRVVKTCTDKSYDDWARNAVCGVSYYNHLKEYNISYDSTNGVNISDILPNYSPENIVNGKVCGDENPQNSEDYEDYEESGDYSEITYSKKPKEEVMVEVGSTIDLKCSSSMENITNAKWIETGFEIGYGAYVVNEIVRGGNAEDKSFMISAHANYSKDLKNSTLTIKNVRVSNGGCYTYQVFSGEKKEECTKCIKVDTHVVFRWNYEGDNITKVACYVGDNNMQPFSMYWKSRGVSAGGRIALDLDEHNYKVLDRYESSEIRVMGKYDRDVSMLWCRHITYSGYIIEYPIRFFETKEHKFHKVSNQEARISKNYW
uniref:Immunoglobulin-like domain protein n=1 Tax=Apapanepox virus TaxID=3049969 RepID=A0AAT9UQ92_9POXV